MKKLTFYALLLLSFSALAGNSRSTSSYSSKPATGTGSKMQSTTVSGHVTKQGTYVAPHLRSTADTTKTNNWSTKGNSNPYTGKRGKN